MAKKRKIFKWLDPEFQRKYTFFLVAVVFVLSAILVTVFWFFSDQMMATLVEKGLMNEKSLYLLIQTHVDRLILSLSIAVLVYTIIVLVAATIISHRIVGPIFAIKRSLELLNRGEIQQAKVKLREGDEFKDVADLLNSAIDSLSKHR